MGIVLAPPFAIPDRTALSEKNVNSRLIPCAAPLVLTIFCLAGCTQRTVFNSSVSTTKNPLVALYSVTLPEPGSVSIQFGLDTNYGLNTWSQPASDANVPVKIFVAGMRPSTAYHMRAVLTLSDGTQITDADHVFTTGSLSANLPQISVSTPSNEPPQPGIEMLNLTGPVQAVATDLTGHIIWTYTYADGSSSDQIQPIKLLPNGHFLVQIGPMSSFPVTTPPSQGTITVLREVDLAGDTIQELSLATLNARLAEAGFNLTADAIHHDVTFLPNGHLLLIVNSTRQFSNLTGLPGTTAVLGDQIVDLDSNWNPDWVWDSFDHLDVNRHPMQFPDWTHTNAVIYSPDDGNIIVSMRHQNWLVKINFQDARGDGSVLWRLGEGGDFILRGGVDPTDWFWAQHGPSFVGPDTAGVFSLAVFDDGNDRQFPPGTVCGPPQSALCNSACTCFSTGEILHLDESAKTSTLAIKDVPNLYSFFGGNAEVLANGDLEYDLSAASPSPSAPGATVVEVLQQSQHQVVWQMNIQGVFAYRAFRLPSLYPGVQW